MMMYVSEDVSEVCVCDTCMYVKEISLKNVIKLDDGEYVSTTRSTPKEKNEKKEKEEEEQDGRLVFK